MKELRTKTISSRISESDYGAIIYKCDAMGETPARVFRKLILDWLSKHQKKPKNKC